MPSSSSKPDGSKNFLVTGNLAQSSGLPLAFSTDPEDVFYTTNEPIQSTGYLEDHVSGKDVYLVDSLVQSINDEVVCPKHRLPTDIYRKLMGEINRRLPPCTNEKRGHEFKHKRLHVDRSTSQKLANKPKDILTSQCIHCRDHWTGLKYPLPDDPRYPPSMSLFRQRIVEQPTKSGKVPKFSRALLSALYA